MPGRGMCIGTLGPMGSASLPPQKVKRRHFVADAHGKQIKKRIILSRRHLPPTVKSQMAGPAEMIEQKPLHVIGDHISREADLFENMMDGFTGRRREGFNNGSAAVETGEINHAVQFRQLPPG